MESQTQFPKPQLMTDSEELIRLSRVLNKQSQVAVDTESNSLYAYQERVCLIQLSIPGGDFLVDPLAISDLTPLEPLFRNPAVEKVFHAAEYDLICLKRDYNFEFNNIFDTMIASRILGKKELGLGSILAKEFNIQLEKRYQRANWGQRPLPEHLLNYASLDSHYLLALRNRLHAELSANQLLPLANEDFRRLCQVNGVNGQNKSQDFWRINGSHDLHPQKAAVLRELCKYRDQIARAMDRPLFKVFNDNTLLMLAEKCPAHLNGLEKIPGMTQGQIKRHGPALLKIIQSGLKTKPIHPNHSPRPNDQYLSRLEKLRAWRKGTACDLGVPSDVVLPRDLMYNLVERNPKNMAELKNILNQVPWRLERFGKQLLEVLNKAS